MLETMLKSGWNRVAITLKSRWNYDVETNFIWNLFSTAVCIFQRRFNVERTSLCLLGSKLLLICLPAVVIQCNLTMVIGPSSPVILWLDLDKIAADFFYGNVFWIAPQRHTSKVQKNRTGQNIIKSLIITAINKIYISSYSSIINHDIITNEVFRSMLRHIARYTNVKVNLKLVNSSKLSL